MQINYSNKRKAITIEENFKDILKGSVSATSFLILTILL